MMRRIFWTVLFIIGFVQSSGACEAMDMSKLQGKWVLESINNQPVISETPVYFEIDELTIAGFDGCNMFGGRLDAPDQLRMSQRACASNGPSLPLELPDPRCQLNAAEVVGDKLKLPIEGGTGEAVFIRG